ncbi:MAG: hypothetical protein ACR2O6_01870, partial [Ilumatobacteraceae bacterium]
MRGLPRRWWLRPIPVLVYLLLAAAVVGFGDTVANIDCGDTPAMVRLEVAGTGERAGEVLLGVSTDVESASTDTPCTKDEVREALWGDLPFIAGYVALLAVGALAFGAVGYRIGRLRRLTAPMAGAAVAVGVLDLLENAFLLAGVDREPAELADRGDWPFQLAATFSWAKWLLLAVVIAYVLAALVGYLFMPAWMLRLRSDLADPAVRSSRLEGIPPLGDGDPPDHPPSEPATEADDGEAESAEVAPARSGIALSGGGVRSATFALGGMQALDSSDRGWNDSLRVTSVSGGGYMSGAWSLTRGLPTQSADADSQAWAGGGAA